MLNLGAGPVSIAQTVKTRSGQTEFSSKAAGPARDIYAIDKTGEVSLNLETGQLEVKIHMKNFTLPVSLMQKHYNQRYMHTDKFPHAYFKGRVLNWKQSLSDGSYQVEAEGDFTVHGVTRHRKFEGILLKNGDEYQLKAEFVTRLEDHQIEIPVLFFTPITEAVNVKVQYNLSPD